MALSYVKQPYCGTSVWDWLQQEDGKESGRREALGVDRASFHFHPTLRFLTLARRGRLRPRRGAGISDDRDMTKRIA